MIGFVRRLRDAYRALSLSDFKQYRLLSDPASTAGVTVTQDSALSVSAYWNGVTVISQSIGVLDRFLYRRVGDDDRERAQGHPVYRLVHDQPNPYMTPQVFWETVAAHAVSWGNGYAEIEWDNAGRPIALWPITPDKIQPMVETRTDTQGRKSSVVWYRYCGHDRIEADDMVHIPGLGFDGVSGYSPVGLARRSLGLTIAAEEFGAAFFANGSWNGAVLEHPGRLSEPAYQRVTAQVGQERGPMKAHRLKILEEGMKLSRPIVIPPDDAQFLETRQFQIEEIARWLNLPPHKLKHKMGERPGGNLEASQIDYLTDTLLPWTTRIEQELNRKLISKPQRSTYFVEHLFQKILRADITTRMSAYKSLFDLGVVDAQWIAKTENLPKPPEPEPAPAPEPAQNAPPPADSQPDSARMVSSIRAVVLEAMGRYVRRESGRVRRILAVGGTDLEERLEAFYRHESEVLAGSLEPAVGLSLAIHGSMADAKVVAAGLAMAYMARSRDELLALPAKEVIQRAEALLEAWEKKRPLEMADEIAAMVAEEEGHAA